jgi:hypothetical protein
MQWMHGENRGDKRAAPQRARHLLQRNTEKDDGGSVEQHIHKVVPTSV